jgi:acyl carrier protein
MDTFSPYGTVPSAPAHDAVDGEIFLALGRFFDQLAPGSRPKDLTPETALLTSGVLDSLAILQLTLFLGEEFGIEVSDEDFTLENFASIGSLVAFIRQKRVAAG